MKNSSKIKKRTGHIVSHVHWDREWRYPIWETHLMLVDFMNELINMLETDKYPGFLLDGQVIPVLDYLELRPEMTERIKALVSSGKLQIGPWLLLPDEYPVDGECMVRNLLLGNRFADKLGGVFNVGYTSFGWGQTAQLPQIYAGFGIDVAMIGKHVNKKRAPQSEFIWRAPDGTEILTTRFGDGGRHNFFLKIHLSSLFGICYQGPYWKYGYKKTGADYHRADIGRMEQDHFLLNVPNRWYPEEITPKLIEETWATTNDSVIEDDRLMMNGCDYSACQPLFPEMLKTVNDIDLPSDRQWIHSTMPEFVALMKQKIDKSKLVVVEGELRDGCSGAVTGNALSTRLYLKRLNKKAQNLLIRIVEPLAALAAMFGAEYQDMLIRKAWMSLLEAHPHDSINGVTQDQTVLDVTGRIHQSIGISEALTDKALQELVCHINTESFNENDIILIVFNTLPYPRRDVVESWVNLPAPEVLDTRFEAVEGVQVFDSDGNPISTQWQGCTNEVYPVAELHTRAFSYYCQRHRIYFDTGEIPAGGYKVFRIGSIEEDRMKTVERSDSKVRTSTILKTPNVLENEYLQLEMNCNGTFNLTDKQLNRTFYNLNYYEDRGEIGHYWVNKRPMFNQTYTSLGCSAKIWAQESGPLQATLVSEVVMQLPTSGIEKENRRSDKMQDIKIKTSVTLRAGQRQVEINVEFENHHEDHYLRAMFPTGLSKATHANVGGHFTVDRRPIHPQGPTSDSIWPDMATLPQNNFVDVSDGEVGLAFLNDSLTEYEVLDNNERTMALSLLRAVKNWIITERIGSNYPSQKGGQCFGHHSIRYALMPHEGDWQFSGIPFIAEQFNVPLLPVQTRKHNGKLPCGQTSLFEISNTALVFSALKKAEDHDTFVVRLYNPTNQEQKGSIRFNISLSGVWLINLNEERQGEIEIENKNEIVVVAKPQKIITIEIDVKKLD